MSHGACIGATWAVDTGGPDGMVQVEEALPVVAEECRCCYGMRSVGRRPLVSYKVIPTGEYPSTEVDAVGETTEEAEAERNATSRWSGLCSI